MQINSNPVVVRFRAGALANALNRVSHIASEGKSVASGHALVHVTRGIASITAVNQALSVRTQLECETASEQAVFTVHARKLLDFAKTYDPLATLDVSPTEGPLRCATTRTKFSLLKINSDEIVKPAKFSPTTSVKLQAESFQAATRAVRAAMPKDDVRVALNGALVRVESGRARLVATDGHRLHECYVSGDVGPTINLSMPIPRQAVLEADHLCKAGGLVQIESDGQRLRISSGVDALLCKTLPGNFPQYDSLIPQTSEQAVVVDRDTLLAALASIRATLDDPAARVLLSLQRDALILSSEGDGEEASITIDASYSGPACEGAYKQAYLADAIFSINDAGVRIQMIDAMKPLLVQQQKLGEQLVLVMPMR